MRGSSIRRWTCCLLWCAASGARGQNPSAQDVNPAYAKWCAGAGGEKALAGVHSMETRELVEEGGSEGKLESRTLLLGGDMVRIDLSVPGGRTLTMAFDGKQGWREAGELGFGLLHPNDVVWMLAAHHPAFFAPLRSVFVSSSPMPAETRDGARYDVFRVRDKVGSQSLWLFDPGTGLLSRIELAPPDGPTLQFADYRRVGPLLLPFEYRTVFNGKTAYAVHRQSIALNVSLNREFFSAMSWDLTGAARVEGILDRYLKASADPARASKLHSRIVRITVENPATGTSSSRTITVVYPDKILIETDTKGIGQSLLGYDGKVGWASSELQGFHPLKAPEVPGLFSALSILGDPAIENEAPLRRVVGSRLIAGRKTTALALANLKESLGVFYFDDENGHLVRVASQARSPSGNKPVATLDFSDFRAVDGQDIPFEATETRATGQVISKLQSVENNPAVAEAVFRPRQED